MRPPFGLVISPALRSFYGRARVFMYLCVLVTAGGFLLSVLFPTFIFTFDFRNPGAARNNLLDPRLTGGQPLLSGKLEKNGELFANMSALGNFSRAKLTAVLEKDSPLPRGVQAEARRSYRAFLYPLGEPVGGFPDAA